MLRLTNSKIMIFFLICKFDINLIIGLFLWIWWYKYLMAPPVCVGIISICVVQFSIFFYNFPNRIVILLNFYRLSSTRLSKEFCLIVQLTELRYSKKWERKSMEWWFSKSAGDRAPQIHDRESTRWQSSRLNHRNSCIWLVDNNELSLESLNL